MYSKKDRGHCIRHSVVDLILDSSPSTVYSRIRAMSRFCTYSTWFALWVPFEFRQWPTFFCHGRVTPPFDSGFQYSLNNEFLFLQNKKGVERWLYSCSTEWTLGIYGQYLCVAFFIGTLSTQRNVTLKWDVCGDLLLSPDPTLSQVDTVWWTKPTFLG